MSKNWSNLANFTIFKCEFGSENFEIKKSKKIFSWSLIPMAKKPTTPFSRKNIPLMTFYPTVHGPYVELNTTSKNMDTIGE